MNHAWREPGFCVPNPVTYPFQWLWDSCFHALIWAALGDDRCVRELANTFAHQHIDGFVPHMTYWGSPESHAELWGQSMTSTITQPPMYGHCVAELRRLGFETGAEIPERARSGLRNLLGRPLTKHGLIPVWHPWETGCDDSPRWDDWRRVSVSDRDDWRRKKLELAATLTRNQRGAVVGSDFEVGSVGFNALVVWNVSELSAVGESNADLDHMAAMLAANITSRWDDSIGTWTDSDQGSGQARTLDALLVLLIDPRVSAFSQLLDPLAFGATYGPRGVHIGESCFDPDMYWRGPAWPQLGYLMHIAAREAGHPSSDGLGEMLQLGAETSGLAEYWNPESGAGRGAIPQCWAGLGLCVR